MELQWTSTGPPLELGPLKIAHLLCARFPLEFHWTSTEPPLDLHWNSTGPPLELGPFKIDNVSCTRHAFRFPMRDIFFNLIFNTNPFNVFKF